MNMNEKMKDIMDKNEQAKHREILKQNQERQNTKRLEDNLRFRIGEMVLNEFPIVKRIVSDPDENGLEVIRTYMKAVVQLQKAYADVEEFLVKRFN